MSEPIDEFTDNFLVGLMVQFYGDLLKVSRSRGVSMTLPKLREYISNNPYIREEYRDALEAERDGQGLGNHATLNTFIEAQLAAFEACDHQNTKMYSDEIKKLIATHFDLRPKAIIQQLNLLRPIYSETAAYGHFGRELPNFTWENTDKAAQLREAAKLK